MVRGKSHFVGFLGLILAVTWPTAQSQSSTADQGSHSAVASPAEREDAAAVDLRAIRRPPPPSLRPDPTKRVQLDNGMVFFLQEDHELPLIKGLITIRGGSKSEPADKTGLLSIYSAAWRAGGTQTRTGDELDDLLETRAAVIETDSTNVLTFISLSCLKGDFDFVLEIANDFLRQPEFNQEKIDIAKGALRTAIARRNDAPRQIAAREANKIGYGPQSPYARVPEYATVAAVQRKDLLDWHAKYVHPNNVILGIFGDFDSAAMESRLRSVFGNWAPAPVAVIPPVAVNPPQPGIYFAPQDDVSQSEIRIIGPGIRRDDPDFYPLQVLNQIFGAGSSSRLFSHLRTRAGLAYAVASEVTAFYDHPGLTIIGIGTKSATTAQALTGLFQEVEDMRNHPVTQDELQRNKDALVNSFIFENDSGYKVMRARMNLEFHGYPADFLESFPKAVEQVTASDVERVAKKYLRKNQFAVLVVGNAAAFDRRLDTFGQVTTLNIAIPEMGSGGSQK